MARLLALVLFLASFVAFASPAKAVPIDISEAGTIDVLAMMYQPSSSGGFGKAYLVRHLENPPESLSYQIDMTVDSLTGNVTGGTITLADGNSIILGSVANNTDVRIDFSQLDFSFTGNVFGAITGALDEGVANLVCLSECLTVDIQSYHAARGQAIITVTATMDVAGSDVTMTIDPATFTFFGANSAAYINLQVDAFKFTTAVIPEPSTALLFALGLVAIAAGRRRNAV